TTCCYVSKKVSLRELEFVGETILDDIGFVQVVPLPKFHSTVSDVANFENRVAVELTLDSDCPGLNVAECEVRIESTYRIRDQSRVRIDRDTRERRRSQPASISQEDRKRPQITKCEVSA